MENKILKNFFLNCAISAALVVAAVFFLDLRDGSSYSIVTLLGAAVTLLNLKVTSLLLKRTLFTLSALSSSSKKSSGLAMLFILKSLLLLVTLGLIALAALIPGLSRLEVFFFLLGFLSFIPGTLVFSLRLKNFSPDSGNNK